MHLEPLGAESGGAGVDPATMFSCRYELLRQPHRPDEFRRDAGDGGAHLVHRPVAQPQPGGVIRRRLAHGDDVVSRFPLLLRPPLARGGGWRASVAMNGAAIIRERRLGSDDAVYQIGLARGGGLRGSAITTGQRAQHALGDERSVLALGWLRGGVGRRRAARRRRCSRRSGGWLPGILGCLRTPRLLGAATRGVRVVLGDGRRLARVLAVVRGAIEHVCGDADHALAAVRISPAVAAFLPKRVGKLHVAPPLACSTRWRSTSTRRALIRSHSSVPSVGR